MADAKTSWSLHTVLVIDIGHHYTLSQYTHKKQSQQDRLKIKIYHTINKKKTTLKKLWLN